MNTREKSTLEVSLSLVRARHCLPARKNAPDSHVEAHPTLVDYSAKLGRRPAADDVDLFTVLPGASGHNSFTRAPAILA